MTSKTDKWKREAAFG